MVAANKEMIVLKQEWPQQRATKFRQAGFVYLHVALLYEAAAYGMLRSGLLPERFGSPWIWLGAGALVTAFIFVGLYRWQNVWFARVIWAMHGLRLPKLVQGAFFAAPAAVTPPAFYITAIMVVLINLWMLARAGWDV